MIKYLFTELGWTEWENIWLLIMANRPHCAQSVRHALEPNIFLSGPPTQSISTYSLLTGHIQSCTVYDVWPDKTLIQCLSFIYSVDTVYGILPGSILGNHEYLTTSGSLMDVGNFWLAITVLHMVLLPLDKVFD